MLTTEARWYERQIRAIGDEALYPMLNVGSHTAEFRTREQPWIDRHLFAPARAKGLKVVHTDIRPNEGVDLVGDLTNPAFLRMVAGMQFRSAVCSNLLEHVPNRDEIAQAVTAAVVPGGYLLVSCPNVFPYHPDPIDTMYRPSPEELAALFPGTLPVVRVRVRCGNLTTYLLGRLLGHPRALWQMLTQRKAQAVKPTADGMSAKQWLPWLVRPFYQACVVLRKEAA
jgi:hypothetical protein